MKKLVIGLLAHVDAGKTTLSESLLYKSGKIRSLGRVDSKTAYLDNYELEKDRGITIFSKQALIETETAKINLLDTPGHVDFSAEMERTLQVLDYAILIINGADGVQAHTRTLWKLLQIYEVPVFIFINKMDQKRFSKEFLIEELQKKLGQSCIFFGDNNSESIDKDSFYERIALTDEKLMEEYLNNGIVDEANISEAIKNRKIMPCYFGSALKMEGIDELIAGIDRYTISPSYKKEFGAKVFKITRDEQSNRLVHMKITGGVLRVKDTVKGIDWEEKINQIRLYSGNKFEAVNQIEAGMICAVTGLSKANAGDLFGYENSGLKPQLEAALSYRMILPKGCDPRAFLPKLKQLEEEEPALNIFWEELLQNIQIKIMGEIQLEIIKHLIKERYGIEVEFDDGQIIYKETINNIVEGVGHFEPLRHYAEVHLLLEPGERGSGLEIQSDCSEDVLAKNWQRLILSHLGEKNHKGVLTGSHITDIKITLVSGKAHNKHTEGGDFREATFRALRQGLKEAESIILEPYYSFQINLPENMLGRAMTDIERMNGTFEITQSKDGISSLSGRAPVITLKNYQAELNSYTKGEGKIFLTMDGFDLCHNPEEVMEKAGYDSEADFNNPTGSVFCANGSGFIVPWDEVKKHMHLPAYLNEKAGYKENKNPSINSYSSDRGISLEEIDSIFSKTFYANQGKKTVWSKKRELTEKSYGISELSAVRLSNSLKNENREEYLLVDGYNVIFAWPELSELSNENMDSAKAQLADALCNYQSYIGINIILVFDAYKLKGHREEIIEYGNIKIVYTKEAQSADQYIEKFAHDKKKEYKITVATSDGLSQIIVRGEGSMLLSSRELREKINETSAKMRKEYEIVVSE